MVTFISLFNVREFRYLYAGYALSYAGDQVAAVAVAVLVYDRTGSSALTAIAFASAFLPAALSPWLSTAADRLPRRRLLIVCDLARAMLVAVLAIPGLPIGAAIALLYLAHAFTPPFTAARAALMPEVLGGEAYLAANGLTNLTYQISQVAGFAIGGAVVAAITPAGALLVNAATFAVSALLLYHGVTPRPAPTTDDTTRSAFGQARDGLRYFLTDPWLRGCLLLVWTVPALALAFEAIAYPFAQELGGGAPLAGVLLAMGALGFGTGALVLTRWVRPPARDRLLVPLAVLAGAALLPLPADPPTPVVLALLFACGLGCSFSTPLNAEFVRRVDAGFRGRAMGVAIAGIAVAHGAGFLIAGWILGQGVPASLTVGLCGLAALATAVTFGRTWQRDAPDQTGKRTVDHAV